MTRNSFRTTVRPSHRTIITAVVFMAQMGVASVWAAARDRSRHRGYVDGSEVAELAGDDEKLIEVSIQGPLLRMVSEAVGHESEEMAGFLGQIVSISAVVVEVDEDDEDRARAVARNMTEDLENKGWEKLARVREDDMSVTVLALFDDKGEELEGLTVFVSERGDKFVFANIAGRIDLGLIGQLGLHLGIPGLEELTGGAFKTDAKKHKKKPRKSKRE